MIDINSIVFEIVTSLSVEFSDVIVNEVTVMLRHDILY